MGVALVPLFTLGIVSGSVLLAWVYRGSGGSVLLATMCHGSYNVVSGTAGAGDVPAAVISVAVLVWAVTIAVGLDRRPELHAPILDSDRPLGDDSSGLGLRQPRQQAALRPAAADGLGAQR